MVLLTRREYGIINRFKQGGKMRSYHEGGREKGVIIREGERYYYQEGGRTVLLSGRENGIIISRENGIIIRRDGERYHYQ